MPHRRTNPFARERQHWLTLLLSAAAAAAFGVGWVLYGRESATDTAPPLPPPAASPTPAAPAPTAAGEPPAAPTATPTRSSRSS
nr:hypothetical protein [Tepidiforma sp.]